MDESLVIQSDGVTQAKRPRVVPAHDDGRLADRDAPAHSQDASTAAALERIANTLDSIHEILLSIASE